MDENEYIINLLYNRDVEQLAIWEIELDQNGMLTIGLARDELMKILNYNPLDPDNIKKFNKEISNSCFLFKDKETDELIFIFDCELARQHCIIPNNNWNYKSENKREIQ